MHGGVSINFSGHGVICNDDPIMFCTLQVEKMEVDLHTRLTQDQLTPTNVSSPFGRRLIMGCISSLLFVVTTLLAVAGFIRDVLIWAKGKMQRHPM